MKYISKGNGCLLLAILLLLFIPRYEQPHAKIVFHSKRNGEPFYQIYVMEDNGSNVRRITSPDFYDRGPRWFPDGKRILFSRDWERGSGRPGFEFYIIDADGRNEHRFMENHPVDRLPVPSPDGKQILFVGDRDDKSNLYTYHLETKRLKQLTVDGGFNRPKWSPDGRQIVYDYAAIEGENIWTMNADGSRKRRISLLHAGPIRRTNPRWSPSGKYIMYHEDQWKVNGGKLKRVLESIVVQNVHTGVRRVYKFPLADWVYDGCWMGDDQTLLLDIKRDVKAPGANFEIYRYDLVSRRLTNLTNHPGVDHGPHWISGPLAVFPAGKLTILWGQLKQTD